MSFCAVYLPLGTEIEVKRGVKKRSRVGFGPSTWHLGTLSEAGGHVLLHKCSETPLLGTLSHKKSVIFSFLMKSVP